MISEAYIVMGRRGIVRVTKRIPRSLTAGQLLVKLRMTFNPAMFDRPPTPVAEITVNGNNVIVPVSVEAEQRVPRVGVQYVPGLDDIDDDPRLNEFVRDVERVVRGQ